MKKTHQKSHKNAMKFENVALKPHVWKFTITTLYNDDTYIYTNYSCINNAHNVKKRPKELIQHSSN